MTYILLTSTLPTSEIDTIIKLSKGKPIALANDTFQKAVIEGFSQHLKVHEISDLIVINMPNIGAYPFNYTKAYYRGNPYSYKNISILDTSFLNITYFKHWFKYRKTKSLLKKYLTLFPDSVIICYDLYEPWLRSVSEIKTDYNFFSILIIPDLPNMTGTPNTWLYKLYRHLQKNNIQKYIRIFDGFVLLSESMSKALHVENKPHIVLEGIFNPSSGFMSEKESLLNNNNKIFKIIYAGALTKRNSVDKLIASVLDIPSVDIRLELFGSGELVPFIKSSEASDFRIVYRGQVNHDKLIEEMKYADLLINPREPDKEFASYSFPSKTMEYMASGVPVLMYKIPTLPKEYEKHLFLIDELSDNLSDAIRIVMSMDSNYRHTKGKEAQEFILQNKNSFVQTDKIINFIKSISLNS